VWISLARMLSFLVLYFLLILILYYYTSRSISILFYVRRYCICFLSFLLNNNSLIFSHTFSCFPIGFYVQKISSIILQFWMKLRILKYIIIFYMIFEQVSSFSISFIKTQSIVNCFMNHSSLHYLYLRRTIL